MPSSIISVNLGLLSPTVPYMHLQVLVNSYHQSFMTRHLSCVESKVMEVGRLLLTNGVFLFVSSNVQFNCD